MAAFAARVVQGQVRAYRHVWKASVYTTFLSPLLYLGAMGLGLGALVDRGEASLPGGSYMDFLAPGLLAASAMQVGASLCSWPVMAGLRWQGTYRSALSTPLRPADLVLGELAWVAVRLTMTSVAFFGVMLLFGAGRLPAGFLAVLAAVLVGLAAGAPVMAFTALLQNDYGLSGLFRFVLIPLFLLSGAFFPLSELPGWLVRIAQVMPVWHGVELARSASAGVPTAWAVWQHLGVLAGWFAAGLTAAILIFEHRLRP